MGDPSEFVSEDLWLNCSVKEFLVKYLAFYRIADPHMSEVKEAYNAKVARFYDWLSENDIKKIDEYVSLFSLTELAADEVGLFDLFRLTDNGAPTLHRLGGCKIQSYWYNIFNFWLYIMWFCGLRGTVRLNFLGDDGDEEFSIDFLEDDVQANMPDEDKINEETISVQTLTKARWSNQPDYNKKIDRLRELKEVCKNGE